MADLFDMELRALRRDRAARLGPELFLLERAFADCLERLDLIQRRFARALLVGCPDPGWPERVGTTEVDVVDPGPLFASAAGGATIIEDAWEPERNAYDLVIAMGTLDTVNDLPGALLRLRASMAPDALLIGAVSGGETLPKLRAAMRAADGLTGVAAPHVHPRIEASMLAPLVGSAGFSNPVVDVDRAQVSYRSLAALVADLRAMAATSILTARPRQPLTKAAFQTAARNFADSGNGDRTIETFEILHFIAWTPANP
ncbi:MAG TPA: SAM-dependent methyltransferase [Sphingomicrobium sp.]|nr:SAM-dependent methyltransferase [Sphingomicrobium sp.]